MNNGPEKYVDSLIALVYKILRRNDAPAAKVWMATWLSTSSYDSNLSIIRFPDGSVVDGIPKAASATGLSANDPVLVIRGPGVPVTILCKVVGDISLLQV